MLDKLESFRVITSKVDGFSFRLNWNFIKMYIQSIDISNEDFFILFKSFLRHIIQNIKYIFVYPYYV